MDISTGSWFKYLREEVLTEGVRDIGLPENIVDIIEDGMAQSPEKSKTYVGNEWKKHKLNPGYLDRIQVELVDHLVKQYGDYVMIDRIRDAEKDEAEIEARTGRAAFDADADAFKPVEFNDEQKKRAEQVKFVILNLKNVLAKPAGTWRKAFMKAIKALSKVGIPSEKVEFTKEYLQTVMVGEFRAFWSRYDILFAWLNEEPTHYDLIKGEERISAAYETAQEDLNNREDPEQVIHTFDDGSYWYNLEVSSCSVEGDRMAHCGGDNRGVLVSLRRRHQKRKASSSYVTMSWEEDSYGGGGTLYQIKGRANDAPPHETWDHINWFIRNMDIRSVEESGEHSSDYDGFREMNDYLQGQNRDVNFAGTIDEDAIQEAIDEVVNNYEGENSSISGEVQGPDYHPGVADVYVYMNGEANIQIDLGWKGFRYGNNEYSATLGPDDGTPDERFETIPGNTWGGDARDFLSEIEVENISWDLPGEDGDIEWEVKMLTGALPDWEIGVPEPPATAHLEITIRQTDSDGVQDADDAANAAENFASGFMESFEDNYAEIQEKVRSKLAEEGYAAKTAFDREQQGMGEMDLDHWKVYKDGPKLEFWFRRSKRQDNAVLNSGGEVGSVPQLVKMWAWDESREGHIDAIYRKIFGSGLAGHGAMRRIENDDLSRNMARNLEKLYAEQEQPDPTQAQLPFGDEYEAPPASLVLAKDSRFIILPETTGQHEQYPTMLLNWKYEIAVDAKSSPEEVETVKKIVKYFNDHPDMVEEAAAQTIRVPLEYVKATAEATKSAIISGEVPQNAIQAIDSRYGGRAMSGSDVMAERIIMIAKWIKENFDQMDQVEKWVAWYRYLSPLKEGHFNMAREGDIEMDDDANLGRPLRWKKHVQDQLKMLGTYGGTVRDYSGVQTQEPVRGTLGEPQSVGENMEQQITRIDSLLQEKDPDYDLRIYSITVDVALSKDIGGEVQETQTEIRGINGVTTVRTVGDMTPTAQALTGKFEVKFEILGAMSRVKYRDRILIPGMMQVKGLRILRVSPMHRTNKRGTIRTVRETMVNEMGGLAGNLGALRKQRPQTTMTTPRKMLDDIVADWSEGGVMAYDAPMDSTDMRYHVMMPVEELLPYISREFRAPKDAFDGMYQQFIKNGARAPVFVAIGKNGRIKVTGNEDLIWFAKRSGLQELPVFLSYQSQV
jgi:hypothetical protein